MKTSDYADLYDAMYARKDYVGEAACVLRLVGNKINTLLDIGCGTGRHARAFAAHGIHVTGIDIDPAMIAIAQESSRDTSPLPTFVYGDPASAPHGPFAAAVSLFNVVNYMMDRATLTDFFRSAATRVLPDGTLVFDVWNGVAALIDPPVVKEVCGSWQNHRWRAVMTPTIDRWNQTVRLDVDIHLTEDGAERNIHHAFDHRLWTPRELCDVAESTGFRVLNVGTWSNPCTAAGPTDWKLLFHAVRSAVNV